MDMEKTLVQTGSAAGAGLISQYVEKKALFGATVSGGLVASVGIGALAYFLTPSARGNMVQATAGMLDGAATYLALKYVSPMLGVAAAPVRTYAASAPRQYLPITQRVEI